MGKHYHAATMESSHCVCGARRHLSLEQAINCLDGAERKRGKTGGPREVFIWEVRPSGMKVFWPGWANKVKGE